MTAEFCSTHSWLHLAPSPWLHHTHAGPIALAPEGMKAKFEACLALPGAIGTTPSGSGKPVRVKVVANLMRHWQSKQWSVASVELHREV